jgi:hypothetical protein
LTGGRIKGHTLLTATGAISSSVGNDSILIWENLLLGEFDLTQGFLLMKANQNALFLEFEDVTVAGGLIGHCTEVLLISGWSVRGSEI